MMSNVHIVFFPSPGMGHLTPFLRLASLLSSRNCVITLIATKPGISIEESAQISSFFSSNPNIKCLELDTLQEKSSNSITVDDFILRYRAINSSVHLLPPLLSSLSHPVSAIFSDFAVAATLSQLTPALDIPNFIISTTSACCYSTVAYLPTLLSDNFDRLKDDHSETVEIPGLTPLPKSAIPPSWLDSSLSNHILKEYLLANSISLQKVNGILLNSFDWLEPKTISVLLENGVASGLPPVYPIGPLEPCKFEREHNRPWLDEQPEKSVVYVNFGSRTILSDDQVREIGKGLEKSGFPFLWVLRESIDEHEFKDFLERTKNEGVVMAGLVNQPGILAHPAIGGFINQCEWDSVTEAAREGVPLLAWPQHGDHMMNAEVVEKAGLGIWVKEWGWGGERLVRGEEIEVRVRELMGNGILREKTKKVKEEARRAFEDGGSSENALKKVFQLLEEERS